MAGPSNYIPVSDPYSPSYLETLFQDNQPNLLTDFSSNEQIPFSSLLSYNPLEAYVPVSTSVPNIPTSPPKIQDPTPLIANQEVSGTNPSRRPVKRCRNMAELMESTTPIQPRNPAPSPVETTNTYPCGCCHVLREIIHTKGFQYQKLEIHGRIGMICHAIFHQDVQGSSTRPLLIDLSNRNLGEIKLFLEQHCLGQKALGFSMVKDPLSTYYEALCVGLEWTRTQNEPLGSSFPFNAENISSKGKEPVVEDTLPDKYSALKLSDTFKATMDKRKRMESMSLHDFSNYFHLTLEETSKRINLSKKSIKEICRDGGLIEWPHKKLQPLMRELFMLKQKFIQEDPVSRIITQDEISRVQNEMIILCGGVVPIVAIEY